MLFPFPAIFKTHSLRVFHESRKRHRALCVRQKVKLDFLPD
jgi:hypothetical protein